MITVNASEVRRNWGGFIDDTVRIKPQFVTRSRDTVVALSISTFREILSTYTFTATLFKEDDGSITAALNQIDIFENGKDEKDVLNRLASALHEYAMDYYLEFNLWSTAKNRKAHLPFVLNVLAQQNLEEVRRLINAKME